MNYIKQFICKIDKELLDLGALEMDKTLKKLIPENEDKINIKIDALVSKSFKVDTTQDIITGRGIKEFFKNIKNQNAIAAYNKQENELMLKNFNEIDKHDAIFRSVKNSSQTYKKIADLSKFNFEDEKWTQIYELAKDFAVIPDFNEILSQNTVREMNLFDYQVRTVKEVLKKFRGRALLCDEVGLGKTIEACTIMMEYIIRGFARRILILVPPSLVEQWSNELKRKFNQNFITSDNPEFKKFGDKAWMHFPKVISSINLAKRKQNSQHILKVHYDMVIVDEAHHLKNRKTVAWNFINKLDKNSILLLTATPIQNNLEELYNLITLLKPGQLSTYSDFKKNFVKLGELMEPKNIEKLRELVSDVMVRNKRSDVDIKFTNRHAKTIKVSLSPVEKKFYDLISEFVRYNYNLGQKGMSQFTLKMIQEELGSSVYSVMPTLQKLLDNENISKENKNRIEDFAGIAKEIGSMKYEENTKGKELMRIIDNFDDKIIVFTKYKTTIEFLEKLLKQQGYDIAIFHGGMTRKEKENQIEYFRKEAQVLISTEAGGEGRNLQFCNAIINYDLPWNPMAIEQRIGRIHRVGQKRDVYIFNLEAKNTIESYILDILDKKINMFELVVGEVDMILGDLNDENAGFDDMIMDIWASSQDKDELNSKMDELGNKLLDMKNKYTKIKNVDEEIFGDLFKAEEDK
ncbi:DEAD/DEAH box helicase family protein [Clostridium tyrobutyricum]|jgi:SNF2 family DNA or RNA helicase|nr:DEAD/DEAH box helicase family protein [Clostridium tyrobutyricum]